MIKKINENLGKSVDFGVLSFFTMMSLFTGATTATGAHMNAISHWNATLGLFTALVLLLFGVVLFFAFRKNSKADRKVSTHPRKDAFKASILGVVAGLLYGCGCALILIVNI